MSTSVAEASPNAAPTAPFPSASPQLPSRLNNQKAAALSAAELRTGMQQHFRANGTLQQLKTQLRGMMLTELLEQPKTARMLVGGAAQSFPPAPGSPANLSDAAPAAVTSVGGGARETADSRAIAAVPRRSDRTLQTWSCGLADALVENHLRRTRRPMSLSIFSTEAEVPPFTTTGAPSEEEQYLAHLFHQGGSGVQEEDDFITSSPAQSVRSVLQRLVEDTVTKRGALSGGVGGAPTRHLHSCSTQTDAADSTDGATNPLNSLECRLAAVDAKYALTFAQLRRTGASGEQPFFLRSEVERRMAQYKNDMHAQLRSEYEQKYNTFTRVQLQEARDEAEQRYRVLVRNKTEELAEMERNVVVRLEQERARLKLSWEDVHQQRVEMERRQRDVAQQLADHADGQQQKDVELQKLSEACRVLRLQCAKWEELCATRLMELDGARSREERRVEDIRRLQAEHASELRLKDEEVSRLRYRLRLLTREVEVPAGGTSAANTTANAAEATQTASLDPKQIYGLLLRTEELQRNAAVQQQQQQQRWDAAWVASAANATPPQRGSEQRSAQVSPAAASQLEKFTTPPSPTPAAAASAPPVVTHVALAASQQRPSASAPLAAASAVSSPSLSSSGVASGQATAPPAVKAVPTAIAAAPASASLTSSPASSPVAAPQQHAPSQRTSTSPSSNITPSKPSKRSSKASPASTPASKSSSATTTSTSLSATPQQQQQQSAGVAAAAINEIEVSEAAARTETATAEETERAGIVWSEKNKRDIVEANARRVAGGDSGEENDRDEFRVARPWDRPGVGGGGAAAAFAPAAAVGGGEVFNDSFTTDDEALIRSTDEDDSDF